MKLNIKTMLTSPPTACVAALVVAALAVGGFLLFNTERGTPVAGVEPVTEKHTVTTMAKRPASARVSTKPMTRPQRAAALAALGPDAIGELGEQLLNADSLEEKAVFADALALIGTHEAIEQLLANAVLEPDLESRVAIARSLNALSNREGIGSLVTALAATGDRSIQREITSSVARLANGDTVATLAQLYREDPAFRTQRSAIRQAISGIGNESAVRSLAELARLAPEPGLVEAAARGLAKIGSAGAVSGLLDSLERVADSDAILRASLLDQLTRVQNPEGLAVLAQLEGSEFPDDIRAAVKNVRNHTN